MKNVPLKILVFSLALSLFACSSLRIGWVVQNRPGKIVARYMFFTGTERGTADLSAGESLILSYQATVNSGSLVIAVKDPDGNEVWHSELKNNQKDEVEIPASQSGLYTIIVTGKNTRGDFTVAWTEVMVSSLTQVVEDFYKWYMDYLNDPATSGIVLTYRTYRSNEHLTPEFIQKVDTLLATFEREGPGYDPFLCAQNVPPILAFDQPIVSGNQAVVRVSYQSYGFHVTLVRAEADWKIDDIVCAFE
ncbi:MAG TPA: hypothetical protein VK897_18035 [Anaerolineales bacterium]|nr:hypothetical protein [Anaerolineales bacterium]